MKIIKKEHVLHDCEECGAAVPLAEIESIDCCEMCKQCRIDKGYEPGAKTPKLKPTIDEYLNEL